MMARRAVAQHSDPPPCLIHPGAWKDNSTNFACTAFYEVGLPVDDPLSVRWRHLAPSSSALLVRRLLVLHARLAQAARGRSGGKEGAPGSGIRHHVTYARGLLMSLAILPHADVGEYVQSQQGRIR
jgi:hypothetical protein